MNSLNKIDIEYLYDYFLEVDEVYGNILSRDAYDALERLVYGIRNLDDVKIFVDNIESFKKNIGDVFGYIDSFDKSYMNEIYESLQNAITKPT